MSKLYWATTTGDYGSNNCIHVNLAAWTDQQWEMFAKWIPEQERFAFIDRWRKANNEPDWADPFTVMKAGIQHLKDELDNIPEPKLDPNSSGLDTAIRLLEGWMETITLPQPAQPFYYNPPDEECEALNFEDIAELEADE